MLVIGLTGGIGSGKSVVAERFAALDTPVIDADVVSREVVAPGQPALSEIIDAFGEEFVEPDGALNRARLRTHVFSHPDARQQLESILHPRIRAEMLRQVHQLTAPYCILVIPLLIETGQAEFVDRILVVDVEPSIQRERIARRDNLTDTETTAVLRAQTDRETRLEMADDVIDNSGILSNLDQQISELHTRYLSFKNTGGPPSTRS